MRCAVDLETRLVRLAELYAPGRLGPDALEWVLDDYPRLLAEVRELRKRVSQLDDEGAALDARLDALQSACRAILEL